MIVRPLLAALALVVPGLFIGTPAQAAAPAAVPALPGVTIFDPGMPVEQIQATLDATHAAQVDNEMGTQRYAYLFRPGTYGTAEKPLQIKVGYYTELAGLGASPSDVVINGKVEVYNRCLADGGTSNCLALVNFWRSVSNLTIDVNAAGQDGCHASANIWAVSQAASLRRVEVRNGNLSLMDYCTAGPQYASGGFIADAKLPAVTNGSQQQWLTRNSTVASWSNAVWNQVFSGVAGAPSEAGFPATPYTTVEKTPLSREKSYLYVDKSGLRVRVPAAHRDSSGISWPGTDGRSLPLSDFYIAKPSDPAAKLQAVVALGRNLLLTPGVYDIDRSITVWRPGTVVLGLGHATLTSARGATPLRIADVPGVVVAGVTIDAGPVKSPQLLHVLAGRGSAADPVTLNDVYFRVGGPHAGKVGTALQVDGDNVLIDHTWVWRADHGVEGFTDTQRWNTNIGTYGAVINGRDVTATGLFVEHFQRYNTVWNGENGTTILYQNELPYDPPTQAAWGDYAGYKVGATVRNHRLYGAGVYVFNQNNPQIHTTNGFEVPKRPGVKLHHIITVNLSAGTIDHVVNGVGAAATPETSGSPIYVTDYPLP
jgi:hypothetical protein